MIHFLATFKVVYGTFCSHTLFLLCEAGFSTKDSYSVTARDHMRAIQATMSENKCRHHTSSQSVTRCHCV
jgi:hypothetical protein